MELPQLHGLDGGDDGWGRNREGGGEVGMCVGVGGRKMGYGVAASISWELASLREFLF